jgi:putative peptide zinc metalloprotease protein
MRVEKAEAADAAAEERQAEESAGAPPAAPQLAPGIELIGEYKESGFKEPPYIARRADGQTIQMPKLLYLVAEEIDGKRDHAAIAERVSEKFGRGVSPDNIHVLVEEKLRPLGVLANPDGSSPELAKADPMLALKFRAALVPERVSHALTTIFYPFFYPVVIAAVLAGLVAADIWLFFVHGIGQATRELVYNPVLLLMVLGLVVVATALHEIGHATAARYGGAKPGVMGAGIYIVWPAFYTDVTDAYRLDRKGRLRTDLGGVYFNGIFALGIVGAYFLTGFEPLLVLVLVMHLQALQQFLPFLRLDGYYILSDLTGVPDMFSRLKPTLQSLLPGQEEDPRAGELKPWVRRVVTAWVVLLVPILLGVFALMVFNIPRVVATAWDSFFVHWDKASAAFSEGAALTGMGSGVQMLTLVVPAVGMAATLGRGGKHLATGAWGWSEGSAIRRSGVAAVTVGLVGLMAFIWWPNGEYRPIQPGEKGTIQGGIEQFSYVDTGRPGLTAERQEELGGAPLVSETTGDPDKVPTAPTAPGSEDPTSTNPEDEGTGTETGPTSTEPSSTEPSSTGPTATSTEPTETTTTTTETTTTP